MEKTRILVAEDNKIIALEIRERLEELGFKVIALVKTGEEAIEASGKTRPDLILMDIKLGSDMDGIEAAGKINELMDCPIVYLTAYADEVTVERAKLTMPYGYIVKPLDERELKSVIQIALYKHDSEKKIKESEARYRSIVNTLDGYVFIVDENHKLVFQNDQLDTLLGSAPSKGRPEMRCYELLFERNKPCVHCQMENVQKGIVTKTEIRDEMRGRWFYLVNTPVHTAGGKILNQHLLMDITERKVREEAIFTMLSEKEILLREVHHRVKNNLQLILSLIRLQEAKSGDQQVKKNLKSFANRIASMALIHENLYSCENLSRVPFRSYVAKLVSHLMQACGASREGIRTNIDVDDILLQVDTAIPCGMIINELVTNSIKHAFGDRPNGNIYIGMHRNENKYRLNVKDDGIGLAPGKELFFNGSMGMQIINALSMQLGSKPEFYSGAGTEFRLELEEPVNKERTGEVKMTA